MSGGSFNYLCVKSAEEILANPDSLFEMAEWLNTHYPKSWAALNTNLVVTRIKEIQTELDIFTTKMQDLQPDAMVNKLSDVWHDIEWFESNDYGKDRVEAAIQEYDDLIKKQRQQL